MNNCIRYIIRLFIAILIASLVHYFFSSGNFYYLLAATIIASLPTHGSSLRQGLIFFFVFLLIIGVAHFFIAIPTAHIIDILFGVTIGSFCQFIFPPDFWQEFCNDIVIVLQAMNDYLKAMLENSNRIEDKKQQLLKVLSNRRVYPEWIFQSGFNPRLRSGFRFFLVHLDQVMELLLVLDYQLHRQSQSNPSVFEDHIKTSLQINNELLEILIAFFRNNQIRQSDADFSSDIKQLEKEWWEFLPGKLELLDLSENFLIQAALVRNIKDMRGWLLKLASTLPNPQ